MESYLIIRIPFELGQAVVYTMRSPEKKALNRMLKLILIETHNFKENRRFHYQVEKAGYKVGRIDVSGKVVVYNGDDDEWLLYNTTKTKEVPNVIKNQGKRQGPEKRRTA